VSRPNTPQPIWSTATSPAANRTDEYKAFESRDLTDSEFVYVWADGVRFRIRLEEDRLCCLVLIGVKADGSKELLACADGYRESTDWRADVLRDLKNRGMSAPVVAVGGGALGFWAALAEVWPDTREQRCWGVHKTANILDALPKRLHRAAKAAIHEIYGAETRPDANAAIDDFARQFGDKYPKAGDKLTKDREALLTFNDRCSLGAPADGEPDRVDVRHRPVTHQGHQRRRSSSTRAGDGLQAP
jgi:transposase-like protein